MKKTTLSKAAFAVLVILLHFSSYSQSKTAKTAASIPDPILALASKVASCPNDLEDFSEIYLCGKFDTKKIDLSGIANVKKIEWLVTNAVLPLSPDCPDKSASALLVKTGTSYDIDTQGSYRVVITYNNGSFDTFYFNVYKNDLDPKYTSKDIICGNPGSITITSPTTGYLFSLDNTRNYQSSPVFPGVAAGTHTVYIKLAGASAKTCDFPVTPIEIKTLNLVIEPITYTQPVCGSDKGTAKVVVSGLPAGAGTQYTYTLNNKSTGALVGGPIVTTNSDYTFLGLAVGTYEVTVKTADCTVKKDVIIIASNPVTATVVVTKQTTCTAGEITIKPLGGTPFAGPLYNYYINGAAVATTNPVITAPAGTYNIIVEDALGCKYTIPTFTTAQLAKPEYTVKSADVCYGQTNGQIEFVVTNTNGYTLEYSFDNGGSYSSNPIKPWPTPPTTYDVVLRYKIGSGSFCYDPKKTITIKEPAAALTASGGVAELAGCGPNGTGRVRITNPQGGTPPYEYSFAGGAWSFVNEAYLAPSATPYTISIRDAGKVCTFDMKVTLDPQPAEPTATASAPTYNCNGDGTSTVTVTSPPSTSYTYEYFLDASTTPNNPPAPYTSNQFVNVPSGSHDIKIKYKLGTVPTYSNLLNEDFGSGPPVKAPGIAAAYCFNTQVTTAPYSCVDSNGKRTRSIEDNQYSVAKDFWRSDAAWYHFKDHTTAANAIPDANGRFLIVNIGGAAGPNGILYSKKINDIIPNQPIMVEAYLANLLELNHSGGADPSFSFELVDDSTGKVIAQQPPIPPTPNPTGIPPIPTIPRSNKWELRTVSLDPGANTSLTFNVRSGSIDYNGNDAVMDDIKVYQIPKSCTNEKIIPFEVASQKAFVAVANVSSYVKCVGSKDGSITIIAKNFDPIAGFEYTTDGGTKWFNSKTATTVVGGLAAGFYTVKVRYNPGGACTIPLGIKDVKDAVPLVLKAVAGATSCSSGAIITATVTGGNPAYSYELRKADGIAVVTAYQLSDNTFKGIPAGDYTVFVKDANGCETPVGKAVKVLVAVPPTVNITQDTSLCFDPINGATMTINISGGVPDYTYRVKVDAGAYNLPSTAFSATSFTYKATTPGTYTFEITDSYGCVTAVPASQVINAKLTAKIDSTTELNCDPAKDAVIIGTISGGTAPFVVTKVSGPIAGTFVQPTAAGTADERKFTFTTATSGVYKFQITDKLGCVTSTEATVNAITNPTVKATPTDPKCTGYANGEVLLEAAAGSPGYTYKFAQTTAFATATFTPTTIYTGLKGAIEYSYQVKDSKGCVSAVQKITLTDPTAVSGTIEATELACSKTGVTAAIVTIKDATGGAGGYTYSFNGGNYKPANTFSTTASGEVTATIKDKNGCVSEVLKIIVAALSGPIGIDVFFETGLECPAYQAHVKFQAIGGSAPIRYQVTSQPSGTSIPIESSGQYNLNPGDYIFRATDKSGCSFDMVYNVKAVPDITAGGSILTAINCFGGTGKIQFTVAGVKDRGYDYVIKNAADATIQSGTNQAETKTTIVVPAALTKGVYTITLTDKKTSCPATYAIELKEPTALVIVSAIPTKISCNNDESEITVTVSGGTASYSYAVLEKDDNTAPSYVVNQNVLTVDTNNGTDKNWTVYVKDANSCTTKVDVSITAENAPKIDNPATQCYTGTDLTVTISGTVTGTPSYSVDNITYDPSPIFKLGVGNHTLYIKDGFGCIAQTSYKVAAQLTLSAVAQADVVCTANTTINLTATGGTPTLKYEVSSGGAYTTATNPYVTAIAGTYTFRVSDAATPMCEAFSAPVVVNTKTTTLTMTSDKTDVKCFGAATGTISITNPSGVAPHTYSITRRLPTAAAKVTQVSNGVFTGLIAGTYDVQVTDKLGCTSALTSVVIDELEKLSAKTEMTTVLTCGTVNNTPQGAIITVSNPAGGSGVYEYSYNGGTYTPSTTYSTTASGSVTISMRDKTNNGCSIALTAVVVNTLNPPVIDAVNVSTITCKASEATSTATITVTGGTPTLVYTIESGPTINVTGKDTGIFTGLIAGNYVFKVTDTYGCSDTENKSILSRVNIDASLVSQVDVLCFGDATGSAKINVTNSTAYTAVLTPATGTVTITANTVDVTGLKAGAYTVRVTDTNTTCYKDVSFTITEAPVLELDSFTNVNANCITPTATVTVTAKGGKGPYKYAFVADGVIPVAGDYKATNIGNLNPATPNWDVWVLDANSCAKKIGDVAVDKDPLVTLPAPAAFCFTGAPFTTITLVGTGKAPLVYSVNSATITGNTYEIKAAGTYTFGVKDANNCTEKVDYTVDKQRIAQADLEKNLTCSVPKDAKMNVSITNGFAPFSYKIYKDGVTDGVVKTSATATFSETFATAGNYKFEITDTKLCVFTTEPVAVTDPVQPVLNPIVLATAVLCNGDSNAAITVTYDNTQGMGPFVINVKQYTDNTYATLLTDLGVQTSGLAAGFYRVTLTDSKGCEAFRDIEIVDPKKIAVTNIPTGITCNLDNSGETKGKIEITSITEGTGPYTIDLTSYMGYAPQQKTGVVGGTGLTLKFDIIDYGIYKIVVTDSKGCSWTDDNIEITRPPGGLGLVIIGAAPACGTTASAEIAITSAGSGAGPFWFAIFKPGIKYTVGDTDWLQEAPPGSKKATFPGLIPGVTYSFIVYDEISKCYYYQEFKNAIPTQSTLTATGIGKAIRCKGDANGAVDLTILNNYATPVGVKYEIFNSSTLLTTGISAIGTVPAADLVSVPVVPGKLTVADFGFEFSLPLIKGLAIGSYYVLVTETSGSNDGCAIVTAPFRITESATALTLNASSPKNDNSCTTNAGSITAIAQNGTSPYQYAIVADGAMAPTTFANPNTFYKDAGKYDVYAKDAYGCIIKADVEVKLDPTPTIGAQVALCYTGTPLPITITGNTAVLVGPVTYSVDNGAVKGAYKSDPKFNLLPGTYTLNLKDGNGCVASTPFVINEQLTLTPTLTKPLDCKSPAPNATVTVKAGGGNAATYTYAITVGATINTTGASSGIFTGLADGDYTFEVSDGVCSETTTVKIDPLELIVPKVDVTQPLCVGFAGQVIVSATGGTGSYEYKKGIAGTYDTNNVFSQTALENPVDYYVKDTDDCVEKISVTLTDPAAIVITKIDVVQLTCGLNNDANQATITVTASGGTGDLEYSFNNGGNYSFDPVHKTTIAGDYDIIVKDANGCFTAKQTVNVNALVPPTLAPSFTPVIDCTDKTTTVSLNKTDGVAPFTYTMAKSSDGIVIATQTDNDVFLAVAAGNYIFRVTDAKGCIDEKPLEIAAVIPIQLQEEVTANVDCFNAATGKAKFTVSGFSASGNYDITVVTNPAGLTFTESTVVNDVFTLTDLKEGTYNVTVTDNTTHCPITKPVTITQPAMVLGLTAVASNVNCNNTNSLVTMTPTGGTATYEYAFVEAGPTVPTVFSDNTNLDTATLTNGVTVGAVTTWSVDVYVKDANGCTAFDNITITKDVMPTIIAPAQQCFTGANLTVDLGPLTTVYGGSKTYTLDGADLATSTATLTAPGTYKLGIRDDNGCEAFVTYKIEKQLEQTATRTKDLDCSLSPDATVKITVDFGVAPYSTQLYAGTAPSGTAVGTPVLGASFIQSITTAGDYYFVSTDSQGCTDQSDKITITAKTTPDFTHIETLVSCFGSSDGTITITPKDGLAPYKYNIDGGVFKPLAKITGLPTGKYKIIVKDSKDCPSAEQEVEIKTPAILTTTASVKLFGCNASNTPEDAVVTIAVPTTGTAPYTYSFNDGAFDISNTFAVSSAQTVTYKVLDANACEFNGSIPVVAFNPPTTMTLGATPIYCSTNPKESTVKVTAVAGGSGSYKYEIISPISMTGTGLGSNEFPGLQPDVSYQIKVTDLIIGCSIEKPIEIKKANEISVIPQLGNDVYCYGDSTGSVSFEVSNYITASQYTYSLATIPATNTPSQVGDVITYTGLSAGKYTFTVTDKVSGCVATVTDFEIKQPVAVLDFTSEATNINCDKKKATITVTAAGGTESYGYAVVKAGDLAPTVFGSNKVLEIDTNNGVDMDWMVYVQDANGCPVNHPQVITLDPLPTIAKADVVSQCADASGKYHFTIDLITGVTGVGPFEFDFGQGYQTVQPFEVSAPGDYYIIVKDKNGCTNVATPYKITILEPLTLKVIAQNPPSCYADDGSIEVEAAGGSTNYEYKIGASAYGALIKFPGLAVGQHTITVRDITTKCTFEVKVDLKAATLVTGIVLTPKDVSCNGGSDGTITVTLPTTPVGTNNNPVYTYTISPSPVGVVLVGNVFTNLPKDTYTVTVISARGCKDSKPILVDEPAPIDLVTVAPIVTPYGCNATTNGTNYATITVKAPTGGSGNYTSYDVYRDGTLVEQGTIIAPATEYVYTETDLLGGDYSIVVKDDNGCSGQTAVGSLIIDPFVSIDFADPAITVTKAITCTATTETIQVDVNVITNGGVAPTLSYTAEAKTAGSTFPLTTNTTGLFPGLTLGDYLITVTNTVTGCSIKTMHYVNNPNTFELQVTKVSDVICADGSEGNVTLFMIDQQPVPVDDAGPFDYVITDKLGNTISGTSLNVVPVTISSLKAGLYSVSATLKNSPECTVTNNFTIDGPLLPLAIDVKHTEITCAAGNDDGTITVSALGGWDGGYEFKVELGATVISDWNATQFSFTGLSKGTYTVSVRDVKGCVDFDTVVLDNPTPISTPIVNASSTLSLACKGDTNGSIIVDVPTGGQGSNYWYTLNTVPASVPPAVGQLLPIFNGLTAGTYTVTVTDAWGCSSSASANIVISEPNVVTAGLVVKTVEDCVQQPEITLTGTGGNGTYSYSVDGVTNWTSFVSPITFTLPKTTVATTYSYFVQDSNGCKSTVSNSIGFIPVVNVSLSLDLSNAKIICFGDRTARIVATAQGGLGNYIYTLTDNMGLPLPFVVTQTSPGVFTDLPKGNYLVTVASGDCATVSKPAKISEPTAKFSAAFSSKPVSCNGGNDGRIIITPSGGTAKYQYSIDPPDARQTVDKNTFVGLRAGTYNVYAQDANGCPFPVSKVTITEPNPISAITKILKEEACDGDKDGAFTIDIKDGTGPYKVSLDKKVNLANPNYTTLTLAQMPYTFDKLSGGEHTVYILDANGCDDERTVAMNAAVKLDPIAIVEYGCLDNKSSNTVTVTLDASITNAADVIYTLVLNGLVDGPSQSSEVFSDVVSGTHFIRVDHKNGCSKDTQKFTIDVIDKLEISSLKLGGLNEIVATATGGSRPYQFIFESESTGTKNSYIYYKSGYYAVTVTDANGCVAAAKEYFEFIDIEIPTIFTPDGNGTNDNWEPLKTENYKDLEFLVFDRYGRKLATFRQGQSWDGKYNGTELPSGDYWYILKLNAVKDAREFVGHFTLYR
ncbi:T9SS type B sorting domain-containing protein [Flavobacterium sp. ZB4P13]|uniref:T9SS type B sorting domain-containing protein n=1 Tax=Flavobacterium sp. ZB4P13 TaxID=3401728 RepID=UPI003AB064F9